MSQELNNPSLTTKEATQISNYRYKKFVHNNGQMEIIIDTKDGILSDDDYTRVVRDPINAGTYNYYGPRQDGIGHKDYDVVDPYIDFGNGLGDRTSLENRSSVPMSKKVFGIDIHVGPSKILFGELPSVMIGEKIRNAERKFKDSQKICESNYDLCKKDD